MKNTYDVIDRQTGRKMNAKPYTCRKRASSRANKLDMIYGGCRYYVKINWADEATGVLVASTN